MPYATYEQATGLLSFTVRGVEYRFVGYSGRGIARNRPGADWMRQTGPIPAGLYDVGKPQAHPRLGPLAFPLVPCAGTDTHERSGFFIHGDNAAHDASQGCIVLPRVAREALRTFGITSLHVVPTLPSAKARAA